MKALRTFLIVASVLSAEFGFGQKNIFAKQVTYTAQLQCNPTQTAKDAAGNYYQSGTAGGQILTQKISSKGALVWQYLFTAPFLEDWQPAQIIPGPTGATYVVAAGLPKFTRGRTRG